MLHTTRDAISDLQLLAIGMYLADPAKVGEDIKAEDFADLRFSQLVTVLACKSYGKDEKQEAIRHFIGEVFFLDVGNETWREELYGTLRVSGEFGKLAQELGELNNYDTQSKAGQIGFMKHFNMIANSRNDRKL